MYVIAASPLSKIFLDRSIIDPRTGEWVSIQKRCLDDPEFINSEEPFDITVKRPSGAVVLTYGVPKNITWNAQSDEKSLLFWLTGGPAGDQCQETDCYGIAEFNVGFDTMQLINRNLELSSFVKTKGASLDETAKKRIEIEQKSMMQNMESSITGAHKKAREIADARVKRSLRQMYVNLQRQWEINQEAGKGKHMPSNSEALGAYILSAEIAKAGESRQKMIQKLNNIMDTVRA